MKRILVSLVVLCLVLALAGCDEEAPAMNIGPASLTQAEEAIATLDAQMEESASDYVKLQELCTRKEEQETALMELYDRWEQVSAAIEEARG